MKPTTAMEVPERSQTHKSGSEFFICFTARPSSSSSSAMRVPSSKSLMSPGRAAPSLSASLSRRLRTSGSVKGGAQSPMFPPAASGRRKSCAFEAAEPSSPKVTCIGQVRVKSKKKKMKKNAVARSRSQRSGGEASFRRSDHGGRNQNWVNQLPLSICEAVRNLGSELNCILPCGNPCSSRKGEEKRKSRSSGSCGAALARWLMAIDEEGEEVKGGDLVDDDEGSRRELGFLVRERERKELEDSGAGDLVLGAEVKEVEDEETEESRVSVCVPPRNALLLMRCRSDPVRVAALADRFWGSPAAKIPCRADDDEEGEVGADLEEKIESGAAETGEVEKDEALLAVAVAEGADGGEEQQVQDECEDGFRAETGDLQSNPDEVEETQLQEESAAKEEAQIVEREEEGEMEGKRPSSCSSSSSNCKGVRRSSSCKSKEGGKRRSFSSKEKRRHSFSTEREARRSSSSREGGRRRWSFSVEKEELVPKKATISTPSAAASEAEMKNKEDDEIPTTVMVVESSKATQETTATTEDDEGESAKLPDCLLLMMYEPKLSMEVSKETWVCSTDFLRWGPNHGRRQGNDGAGEKTAENDGEKTAAEPPPPPPAAPVATVQKAPAAAVQKAPAAAEQKTPVAAAAYGPFVLTRCKSEPVRTSDRLAPLDCFWKSRHQPIGAEGIGF